MKSKAKWLAVNRLVNNNADWKAYLNGDAQLQNCAFVMFQTLADIQTQLGMTLPVIDPTSLSKSVFPCARNFWNGVLHLDVKSGYYTKTVTHPLEWIQLFENLNQITTSLFTADMIRKKYVFKNANKFRRQSRLLRRRVKIMIAARKQVLDLTQSQAEGNPGGVAEGGSGAVL